MEAWRIDSEMRKSRSSKADSSLRMIRFFLPDVASVPIILFDYLHGLTWSNLSQ